MGWNSVVAPHVFNAQDNGKYPQKYGDPEKNMNGRPFASN